MSSIKYRPEVDGLRTIAILPVLFFHMGYDWISGGFLGVDVFFVISGYLITAIILKEYDNGTFSFKSFWMRRIRRIFPVLTITVVVTLAVSFFISYRPELISYGKVGLAATFSMANITLWQMVGSYWGATAESSPFLHTWSLSVEEQFYFFHPVLLFLLLKFRIKNIGLIFLVIIIGSFALFIYGGLYHPASTFYLLPTRAWELAIGCVIAIIHYRGRFVLSTAIAPIVSLIGLTMIIISYLFIDGNDGLNPLSALSVVGAALIILNNSAGGMVNRFLSLSPMVFIGKISYSLYMWHWPVIVLGKHLNEPSEIDSQIVVFLIIVALTLLSYYLLEKPTRKMVHVTRLVGITVVLSTMLSMYFIYGNYARTYDTTRFDQVEYYGQQYDLSPRQPPAARELQLKRTGIHAPERDHESVSGLFANGGIIKLFGEETPQILLLGDSHGEMWARTVDEIAEELGVSIAFNTMTGTNPFFEIPPDEQQRGNNRYTSQEKFKFDKSRMSIIEQWKPKLVIIGRCWSGANPDVETMEALINYIGEHDGRILLLEQPPELNIGNTNTSMFFTFLNMKPQSGENQYIMAGNIERVAEGQALIRKVTNKYAHVSYFKVFDTFKRDGNRVWVLNDDVILYYDDDHLSYQGTQILKDRLKLAISELLVIGSQVPDKN